MMKLDRVISIATLVAACVAIVLALKKPAPVVTPSTPATGAANVASQKTPSTEPAVQQPQTVYSAEVPKAAPAQMSRPVASTSSSAVASTSPKPDAGINSDAISAILAKTLGSAGSGALTPDSNLGSGEPNIKDQQVTMEGDTVHGRFLTEIGGKDVWVTISGHMGEKDGYATFDPTEFKVGDMEVPVSMVNPLLQRKMAEERDRLKVPNSSQ
jgi:hypothetical protein